jgi:hypothetical protein
MSSLRNVSSHLVLVKEEPLHETLIVVMFCWILRSIKANTRQLRNQADRSLIYIRGGLAAPCSTTLLHNLLAVAGVLGHHRLRNGLALGVVHDGGAAPLSLGAAVSAIARAATVPVAGSIAGQVSVLLVR